MVKQLKNIFIIMMIAFVTIGGATIKLNTGDGTSVEGAWADIIKGAISTTKTAVFG